jgi:hypothetical protein
MPIGASAKQAIKQHLCTDVDARVHTLADLQTLPFFAGIDWQHIR